jgi:acetolactate synthase regulatory subunit
MANTEGALERILGRLRQRSFAVCSLNAGTSANNARMDVRITVESTRAIDLAIKQLNKLIDVDGVEIIKAEELHPHHHEVKAATRAHSSHQHHEKHTHVAPFEHLKSFELTTSQIGL